MNQKNNYKSKVEYLLANGWKKYSKEEAKKAGAEWVQVIFVGDDVYFKPGTQEQIEAQKKLMESKKDGRVV